MCEACEARLLKARTVRNADSREYACEVFYRDIKEGVISDRCWTCYCMKKACGFPERLHASKGPVKVKLYLGPAKAEMQVLQQLLAKRAASSTQEAKQLRRTRKVEKIPEMDVESEDDQNSHLKLSKQSQKRRSKQMAAARQDKHGELTPMDVDDTHADADLPRAKKTPGNPRKAKKSKQESAATAGDVDMDLTITVPRARAKSRARATTDSAASATPAPPSRPKVTLRLGEEPAPLDYLHYDAGQTVEPESRNPVKISVPLQARSSTSTTSKSRAGGAARSTDDAALPGTERLAVAKRGRGSNDVDSEPSEASLLKRRRRGSIGSSNASSSKFDVDNRRVAATPSDQAKLAAGAFAKEVAEETVKTELRGFRGELQEFSKLMKGLVEENIATQKEFKAATSLIADISTTLTTLSDKVSKRDEDAAKELSELRDSIDTRLQAIDKSIKKVNVEMDRAGFLDEFASAESGDDNRQNPAPRDRRGTSSRVPSTSAPPRKTARDNAVLSDTSDSDEVGSFPVPTSKKAFGKRKAM